MSFKIKKIDNQNVSDDTITACDWVLSMRRGEEAISNRRTNIVIEKCYRMESTYHHEFLFIYHSITIRVKHIESNAEARFWFCFHIFITLIMSGIILVFIKNNDSNSLVKIESRNKYSVYEMIPGEFNMNC